MKVTGERIITPEGGFNASWQRHAACYSLSSEALPAGTALDVGCGLGHAYDFLAPRTTIGVDIHHGSLTGQNRPTISADMRRLPFADGSFESVVCIHAIEHVPDPSSAVAECTRVLMRPGRAVFVTPNRLTFGRPDEIIDPYHYIEFDPVELRTLCRPFFKQVRIMGLFGSEKYMEFHSTERQRLESLLRKDPLKVRRFLPRPLKQVLYDWQLSRSRLSKKGPIPSVTVDDFELRETELEQALDLFAFCE